MLVFGRHLNEKAIITGPDGTRTTVTVVAIRPGVVRLGFEAPMSVAIHRDSVQAEIDRENERRDFGGPVS